MTSLEEGHQVEESRVSMLRLEMGGMLDSLGIGMPGGEVLQLSMLRRGHGRDG